MSIGFADLRIASAFADTVAGNRVFPITLTIDDTDVDDQIRLPTFTWLGSTPGGGPGSQTTFGGEFEKTITEKLGIGIGESYVIQTMRNAKTAAGWQDIVATVKYQAFVDAPHEFVLTFGVQREFGRTGADQIGADQYGNTTPTIYLAKGFGDLPIGLLRPLAVSATAGFAIADRELKAIRPAANPGTGAGVPVGAVAAQQFNNGYSNRWVGGLSVQYSLPYLQSQVKDVGLDGFAVRLVPLVEVAYSAPTTSPNNLGTQILVAPGLIYQGEGFQAGVEALIPANKATGRNVGFIVQFNIFLEDLFPNSLGKPLLDF